MKFICGLLFTIVFFFTHAALADSGCRFLRDEKIDLPLSLKSIRIGNFSIHTNQPDLVALQQKTIERSAHFLQTELGWKFPFTRKDLGSPVLEVYFAATDPEFTGTVRSGPVVVFNEKILLSRDFAAIWIHSIAHASQLMYRIPDNNLQDYWFYEATAAWMEGQFGNTSASTRMAQYIRRMRPQIPLDDSKTDAVSGVSLLLDVISRPYRDVVRQAWDQWASSREERVMEILDRVLQLNHLPGLKSYILQYFMRAPFGSLLLDNTTDIVIQPYSAAIFQENPGPGGTGGVHLMFQPVKTVASPDSASLIYYGEEGKEVIIAIKESLQGPWSVTVPYPGMSGYRMLFVNASGQTVRGTLSRRFDATIPAVLEYFRATAEEEGGVLLEWKTTLENGVAFWNIYRIQNGAKERLNALPLPASVDSPAGLHYMFLDHMQGAAYSLEALTVEGFPSPVASTSTQSNRTITN